MIKMELVVKNRRKCKVILSDDWSKVCEENNDVNQALRVEKYVEQDKEYIMIKCIPLRPSIVCDAIEFYFDGNTKEPLRAVYIDMYNLPEYEFKFTVNEL